MSSCPARGRAAGWSSVCRAMYLPGAVLAIAVGLAGVAWAGQRPGAEQMPVWHAHLASGPITLDGKLNEAAWQQAEAVELTQQSPKPGQRMPYRTEVRVLEYKDALYFGFRCWDPNPKAIATHTLARDG